MVYSIDEELRFQIKRWYRKGYSTTEIGEHLGVTRQAVAYHLKRMKVKTRRTKDYAGRIRLEK